MMSRWKDTTWPFLKELGGRIVRDQVPDFASDLAFWSLLSIFPFAIFTLTILGYVPIQGATNQIFVEIHRVMPGQAGDLVDHTIHEVLGTQRGWLLVVSILGTLWSASSFMATSATALNRAYEVAESRPYWKVQLIALGTTVGAAVFVIVAGVAAIFGPWLIHAIASLLGGSTVLDAVWAWIRWPIMAVAMLFVIAAIYYFMPDLPEKHFHLFTPGTITAVVVWVAASILFNLYVSFFNTYAKTYGALGAVIVLMMWLYLTALAVLVGAEVDAMMAKRTGRYARSIGVPSVRKRTDGRVPEPAPT